MFKSILPLHSLQEPTFCYFFEPGFSGLLMNVQDLGEHYDLDFYK